MNDGKEKEEKHVKKEKSNELLEKIKELEEKSLRTQADFQNFKRRTEEEVTRLLKYSDEQIAISLLPIIDNFERALKQDSKAEEIKKYLEGFAIIYQNLVDTLKSFEIKEIECLHQPFDPALHEAILTGKDEQYENGIILEVLQKGYKLKDKLIRPAMVKVNE